MKHRNIVTDYVSTTSLVPIGSTPSVACFFYSDKSWGGGLGMRLYCRVLLVTSLGSLSIYIVERRLGVRHLPGINRGWAND